jgi:hypothetical protein
VDSWNEQDNVFVSKSPRIDYSDVRRILLWLRDTFRVVSIQYDNYAGRSFDAVDELTKADGLSDVMERCGQHMKDLGPATARVRDWFNSSDEDPGVLIVQPDKVFRAALGATKVKIDDWGNTRITKGGGSLSSVDAVASLCFAAKGYEDWRTMRSCAEDPGFTL